MEFSEFTFEVLGETHRIPTRSIYGIGRNYLKHIEELKNETPKEPVVFLKSQASLRPFQLPTTGESDLPIFYEEGIHFEAEITVLLGQTIPLGATAQHADIKGLGLGLDLTRRQVQEGLKNKGLPWARAKNFAGSAMVTPFVPVEPFTNLGHLEFQCAINGTARQKGQSRLMIFPILNLLSSLAQLTTLMPGDLIFTGTPEGVGTLTKGDHITLSWIHPWKHQFEAVF